MVTSEEIGEYLKKVPPLPRPLKESLNLLSENELSLAAKAAASDPALIFYLKHVVNSAAYGFKQELKEPMQIFSALGTERAKQLLYTYMVETLSPKSWGYFKLEKEDFRTFQLSLMRRWERVVKEEEIDERLLSASSIVAAGLIVADAIFSSRVSEVELLRSGSDLDLDTILKRVSSFSFEKLLEEIAQKWEMTSSVTNTVRLSFAKEECGEDEICEAARFLHLLLFYELSRPKMLEAGANSFISFNPEFVAPVLERFQEIAEIS